MSAPSWRVIASRSRSWTYAPNTERRDKGTGDGPLRGLCAFLWFEPLKPADEMVRLVRKRAHVLRADIDQMARIVGAVGEARADPAAALDEVDPLARLAAPQQVDRGHDPAEAGADHGDPAAFACHCRSSLIAGVRSGTQAASVNTRAARARTRTSRPVAQAQLAMAARGSSASTGSAQALHLQLDADDRPQRADMHHLGPRARPRRSDRGQDLDVLRAGHRR